MSPKKIAKIRKSVEEGKEAGGRARYSEFVKSSAQQLLREGMRPTELSNSTGIGRATLFQWSRSLGKKKFRRLKVSTDKSQQAVELKITLPSGIHIECSSVAILKSILECCQ